MVSRSLVSVMSLWCTWNIVHTLRRKTLNVNIRKDFLLINQCIDYCLYCFVITYICLFHRNFTFRLLHIISSLRAPFLFHGSTSTLYNLLWFDFYIHVSLSALSILLLFDFYIPLLALPSWILSLFLWILSILLCLISFSCAPFERLVYLWKFYKSLILGNIT